MSNIYTNSDGRVRYYDEKTHKVTSYPRKLMEEKLGRPLAPNEQVHHKDGNPLNNSLDNLEVVLLGEHQRMHATKYHDKIVTCDMCGKSFLWTAKQQQQHFSNIRRRNCTDKVFCSKRCIGLFSRQEQLRRNATTECS